MWLRSVADEQLVFDRVIQITGFLEDSDVYLEEQREPARLYAASQKTRTQVLYEKVTHAWRFVKEQGLFVEGFLRTWLVVRDSGEVPVVVMNWLTLSGCGHTVNVLVTYGDRK